MLRKMFLAFSLTWLFLCMGCVTTPAKSGAVAYEAAPKRNPDATADNGFVALLPFDYTSPLAGDDLEFRWTKSASATRYRLEIEEVHGQSVSRMEMAAGTRSLRVPIEQLLSSRDLRWRVIALDQTGKVMAQTAWRILLSPSSQCED
ncbi:hypothetical protein HUU05_24940 [candidate division KSB1 bacterium]|nr:hypothetical protein [candidate division KSB1 bacterium]